MASLTKWCFSAVFQASKYMSQHLKCDAKKTLQLLGWFQEHIMFIKTRSFILNIKKNPMVLSLRSLISLA